MHPPHEQKSVYPGYSEPKTSTKSAVIPSTKQEGPPGSPAQGKHHGYGETSKGTEVWLESEISKSEESGFVSNKKNKKVIENTTINENKNPWNETRSAGLEHIQKTTGETALDYFTTRRDIGNYNKEENWGDATIDLDNAEVRKLWHKAKALIGDEPITKKAMIKSLNELEKQGEKTFGTGLRGDARWAGYMGTRDDYTRKLDIMAGNYEAGTNIFKYQRQLIDANKPFRGTTGDSIGKLLLAMIPGGAALTAGVEIYQTLNPQNKTEMAMKSIFNFEMGDGGIKINDETSSVFSDYDIRELDRDASPENFNWDNDDDIRESQNNNTTIDINSPGSQYGIWIGTSGGTTGEVVDTDGDGIDDRWQTGPGQPSQQETTTAENVINEDYPWWPWEIFEQTTTT